MILLASSLPHPLLHFYHPFDFVHHLSIPSPCCTYHQGPPMLSPLLFSVTFLSSPLSLLHSVTLQSFLLHKYICMQMLKVSGFEYTIHGHYIVCSIVNPQRASAGGLRYLSCACVCVFLSVCVCLSVATLASTALVSTVQVNLRTAFF